MEDRDGVNDGSQVIGEFLHHGPAGRKGVGGVKGKWASKTQAGRGRGGEARVTLSLYLSLNQPRQVPVHVPPCYRVGETERVVEMVR
jgi:hypothetical protein